MMTDANIDPRHAEAGWVVHPLQAVIDGPCMFSDEGDRALRRLASEAVAMMTGDASRADVVAFLAVEYARLAARHPEFEDTEPGVFLSGVLAVACPADWPLIDASEYDGWEG